MAEDARGDSDRGTRGTWRDPDAPGAVRPAREPERSFYRLDTEARGRRVGHRRLRDECRLHGVRSPGQVAAADRSVRSLQRAPRQAAGSVYAVTSLRADRVSGGPDASQQRVDAVERHPGRGTASATACPPSVPDPRHRRRWKHGCGLCDAHRLGAHLLEGLWAPPALSADARSGYRIIRRGIGFGAITLKIGA